KLDKARVRQQNICVTGTNSAIYVDEICVVRKLVEENRVLFVCRGTTKPTFENGGLMGLTIEESMIIVATKGNLITSGQTTIIETYLSAIRDDDGREEALKYRGKRFVDNACTGWKSKQSLLSQRIENVLFDCTLDK
ncbi:hypothetical protein V7S43_003810, partial [Phytophthora oleae]